MKKTSAARPCSPWLFAAEFLLLLLTLCGSMFSIVSVYEIPVDCSWLLLGCIGVSLLCWVLVALPRRWGLTLLAAAAGLVALWVFFWETLREGALAVGGEVYVFLDARLDLPVLALPEPLWNASLRADAAWFLIAAAAVLGLFLALLIVRSTSASGVFLLTFPWLLPAFLAETLPDWLPLMALAAGWLLLLLTTSSHHEDPVGAARFTCLCTLPAAAFLLLLTWALPQEGYEQPEWTLSAQDWIQGTVGAVAAGEEMEGLLSGLYPGGTDTSVRLDNDEPPRYSQRTVLKVESEYQGRVYLRGTSAAIYEGDTWLPLSDETYGEIGLDSKDGGGPLQGYEPLNFPSMTAPDTPYYEMVITYVSSLNGMMFTPYQLLTTPSEIEDVEYVNDSHLERSFGVRTKNLFFRPDALPDKAMQELPWDAARAEARYRMFVQEHYLDVPEELGVFLDQWFADAAQTYQEEILSLPGTAAPHPQHQSALDWAARVTKLLECTTSYDLNAPSVPEGEDFVAYFLGQSHRGYCMHYATAATLLLRWLGIPARYVTGYTTVLGGGETEVLDSDAHAWVEVYLDGYGWYPVEVTPAAIGETTETVLPVADEPEVPEPPEPEVNSPLPPVAPTEPEASEEPETPEDPVAETPDSQEVPETPGNKEVSPVLITVLAVLGAIALWLLTAWGRRQLWNKRMHSANTNAAVIAAYGYLERLHRWGVEMDPLVESLAQKARFSQHRMDRAEQKTACRQVHALEARRIASLPRWKQWWFRWLWIP